MTETEKNTKLYEVGFLLVPTITEDNVPIEAGKITIAIENAGGRVVASDLPRARQFAYSVSRVIEHKHTKYANGYFGWVRFELVGGEVKSIKEILDSNTAILRFLILNLPKTLPAEPIRRRPPIRREKKVEGPKVEVSTEQIDKEIEEMLAGAQV